jgi:hypothetical protein
LPHLHLETRPRLLLPSEKRPFGFFGKGEFGSDQKIDSPCKSMLMDYPHQNLEKSDAWYKYVCTCHPYDSYSHPPLGCVYCPCHGVYHGPGTVSLLMAELMDGGHPLVAVPVVADSGLQPKSEASLSLQ